MTDRISRRDLIKGLGAAGVGGLISSANAAASEGPESARPLSRRVGVLTSRNDGEITALSSTSEVFIPSRGRGYMKFSFDFPEPVVSFGEHRFGFLVFTAENTYALDRDQLKVSLNGDSLHLIASGFTWAGGQQRAKGSLDATFTRSLGKIEWDVTVEMDQPIKTVTTVIRD